MIRTFPGIGYMLTSEAQAEEGEQTEAHEPGDSEIAREEEDAPSQMGISA